MRKSAIIREKLKNGELVVGTHTSLCHPVIVDIFGHTDFDAVWIDQEHAATDRTNCLSCIMAAGGTNLASIVRVPGTDITVLKPVLEMGPDGVVFPMINSPEEARKAIEGCLYPPYGTRGYGPLRASEYGAINAKKYVEEISKQTLKFIQIEHIEAVKKLPEILKVKGIDAVIIGPCDLSASVSELPDYMSPVTRELILQISAECKNAGIPVGVSTGYELGNPDRILNFWLDEVKVDILFTNVDFGYLFEGASMTYRDVTAAKEKFGRK